MQVQQSHENTASGTGFSECEPICLSAHGSIRRKAFCCDWFSLRQDIEFQELRISSATLDERYGLLLKHGGLDAYARASTSMETVGQANRRTFIRPIRNPIFLEN
jgi:hypothetical protein